MKRLFKDFFKIIDFYKCKDLVGKEISFDYLEYGYGSDFKLYIKILIISIIVIFLGTTNFLFSILSLAYVFYLCYLVYFKLIKQNSFNKKVKFVNERLFYLINTNNFIETYKNGQEVNIKYLPSIWFSINSDDEVKIIFRLDGSRYQDKYLSLEDKLYHLFELRVTNKIIDKGLVLYELTPKKIIPYEFSSWIEGKKLKCAGDDFIKFNDELVWNFRKQPHALITGVTGGGKSYLLFYIIRNLLSYKATVRVLDPKLDALDYLKHFLNKDDVANSVGNITRILRESSEIINIRNSEFQERDDYKQGKDYKDYGYTPYFIIFDEVTAFFATCDSKQSKEANSYLTDIIMRGRSAGVFVILTTQRADADVISGKIRDQLGLRLSLGQLSADGYVMTFGNEYRDLHLTMTSKIKEGSYSGVGFCYIPGVTSKPTEFYSPIFSKTYDFYEDVKKIIDVN